MAKLVQPNLYLDWTGWLWNPANRPSVQYDRGGTWQHEQIWGIWRERLVHHLCIPHNVRHPSVCHCNMCHLLQQSSIEQQRVSMYKVSMNSKTEDSYSTFFLVQPHPPTVHFYPLRQMELQNLINRKIIPGLEGRSNSPEYLIRKSGPSRFQITKISVMKPEKIIKLYCEDTLYFLSQKQLHDLILQGYDLLDSGGNTLLSGPKTNDVCK